MWLQHHLLFRHDELKRELREKRQEDHQIKLDASLGRALPQQVAVPNRRRMASGRSNGVCYQLVDIFCKLT